MLRHDAAVRAVGRLPDPPAERQPSRCEEIEQLRDRIGAVLRVQQRIGERRLVPEVRRLAQQRCQRMSGRQRAERGDEIPNSRIVGLDAEPSAELLQHVDAGPSVRRIHHQVHRAVGLQHVAQRAESRIGIRQMMEDAGADDLIEARLQLAYPLDGELVDLEIVESYFRLSSSV